MSDQRKLPVLMLATDDIEKMRGALGYVWAVDTVTESTPQHMMSRYEPAVPRCKTCPHFAKPVPHFLPEAFCYKLLRITPNDGEGYCHEHPEALRD